jgi:thiamine monophosphate synthase
LPVFPIGGITPENVASLAEAGATRAAVGAGILAAPDPAAAAIAIDRALRGGGAADGAGGRGVR